jgi:hypothetical protein
MPNPEKEPAQPSLENALRCLFCGGPVILRGR